MRDRDLDGITYIRIVSVEREAADREDKRFRDLWEINDRSYLQPPQRSVSIRIWALLKSGPLTVPELAERLHSCEGSVRSGIHYLRQRGQRIIAGPDRHHNIFRYQLHPGPPLKIVESPRGLRLASLSGRVRADEVMIELK